MEMSYIFSPTIPTAIDAVPIAFISVPSSTSDNAISIIGAERYVRENFSHIEQSLISTASQSGSALLNVIFGGTTLNGTATGAYNYSGIVDLQDTEQLELDALCSPIYLQGLFTSRANSWQPIIKKGIVWRHTFIDSNEINPGTVLRSNGTVSPTDRPNQNSWLIRSGLNPGDEVILIYTVPECSYGSITTNTSTTFPGSNCQLRQVTEIASPSSPNILTFRGDIKVLLSVTVNGAVTWSGNFDNTSTDSFISSFDNDKKTIVLKGAVSPDATVLITYLSYADFYKYSGFRDWTGAYWPYDANPEFGHIIGDSKNNVISDSADCLLQLSTIYLIPSAVMKITSTEQNGTTALTFKFDSAFNYGETHFVRHIIGRNDEEIQVSQQVGPTNTYGYAVFGRNFYDQTYYSTDDVFSKDVPSMLPLGRISLAAPSSINSVAMADIRMRGGGLPYNFPLSAISSSVSGLATVRGYWDMGIWVGQVIKKGGIATIKLDPSILNQYTPAQVEEAVNNVRPPGYVYNIVYESLS